jgi:hypothetical protein
MHTHIKLNLVMMVAMTAKIEVALGDSRNEKGHAGWS